MGQLPERQVVQLRSYKGHLGSEILPHRFLLRAFLLLLTVLAESPRPGEVDGVDYSFVTAEQFQQLIDDGALLEWAEIHRGLHRSGTPAEPVRAAARAGFPVLIEVDLAGAQAVKAAMPEADHGVSGPTELGDVWSPDWSVAAPKAPR